MVTATNSEEIPWIKPEDVWPDKNTWSFAARGTHKVAVGGAIRVARTQVHTDATPPSIGVYLRAAKLGAWIGTIEQILEEDKVEGRKQRHTAKRIFERLRDEHRYTGGYTIVKDYVRLRKLSQREMFVPLEHPPGEAQADFSEAMVVIAGVERKAHYLVMDLPQSDDCFVMAFPAETTEAFLEGHNHAFAYFGGVPRTILYDNTKLAVARILGDGTRMKTRLNRRLGLFPARCSDSP
jgi:transposase